MPPPPPPPLNGEDKADYVHSEAAALPAPSVAALSVALVPAPAPAVAALSEPPAPAPAPSVAAPSHVPSPPPPTTRGAPLATVYASLMSQDCDIRVGDILAAWKKNGLFDESDLRYGRVVTITADEIVTYPSLAKCSLSPASGQSRLRVCARRVPAGSHVLDALPRLFPIDVNDGHVDAKLYRRMGIVSTMLLVQGHDSRWATLTEAAANARATEHKAHVDGAAFLRSGRRWQLRT